MAPQGEADEHDKAAEETEVEPSFAPDQGRVQQLLNALTSDESTLADDAPQQLRELAGEVDPHDADLASNLRQLADIEGAESPDVQVNQQLWQRMPRFVRFDNRARQLDSEYDINAADASPGTALSNLVQLAELDLNGLRTAVANGETGTVRDIREKANDTLTKKMEAGSKTLRSRSPWRQRVRCSAST